MFTYFSGRGFTSRIKAVPIVIRNPLQFQYDAYGASANFITVMAIKWMPNLCRHGLYVMDQPVDARWTNPFTTRSSVLSSFDYVLWEVPQVLGELTLLKTSSFEYPLRFHACEKYSQFLKLYTNLSIDGAKDELLLVDVIIRNIARNKHLSTCVVYKLSFISYLFTVFEPQSVTCAHTMMDKECTP